MSERLDTCEMRAFASEVDDMSPSEIEDLGARVIRCADEIDRLRRQISAVCAMAIDVSPSAPDVRGLALLEQIEAIRVADGDET